VVVVLRVVLLVVDLVVRGGLVGDLLVVVLVETVDGGRVVVVGRGRIGLIT